MKTKTINLYEYDELSQEAKEKALNDYRKNNGYWTLEGDLRWHLKEILQEQKIEFEEIPLKVLYSLSNCQGDGFCFIGNFKFKGYNVKITHKDRYCHKKSTDIFLCDDEGNENFEEYEKLEEEFKTLYYSICDKCEKYGYDLIEEEDSEERIEDYYVSNEILFRENGDIENE